MIGYNDAHIRSAPRDSLALCAAAIAVLGVIAWLYWPATHGGFVWDDTPSLHDEAWLRSDSWKDFVLRNFNGWGDYFRPLVVLLFVLQARVFDGLPGPMHLVSLGIHLADTLLVGLLVRKLYGGAYRHVAWVGAAMLFYGLHPALIEPVDWVGCQFELAVVFFMLLGLLFNASIASTPWRALAVGACFLCAAGFKEAAASFPFLLVLFDLMAAVPGRWSAILRLTWRRQRLVYGAVVAAGIIYLILRHVALGHTLSLNDSLPFLARVQKICLTYLEYWKLILWPMSSIGPIHPFDESQFSLATPRLLAADALAVGIAWGGLHAFYKRRPVGGIVLAVSAALLPVLNIAPIALSESLYHDRYATTAIAMTCVLLPSLLMPLFSPGRASALVRVTAPAIGAVWLAFAVINVRVTVPLWADELGLWKWATKQHPDTVPAKDLLLMAYMRHGDFAHARELADELVESDKPCLVCMLNAANLAIMLKDAPRAARALDKLLASNALLMDRRYLPVYIFTRGELRELQGDLIGAEDAYRDAVSTDPFDPDARMRLALILLRQGKLAEARAAADEAIAQFAPNKREAERRLFERAVATASQPQPIETSP